MTELYNGSFYPNSGFYNTFRVNLDPIHSFSGIGHKHRVDHVKYAAYWRPGSVSRKLHETDYFSPNNPICGGIFKDSLWFCEVTRSALGEQVYYDAPKIRDDGLIEWHHDGVHAFPDLFSVASRFGPKFVKYIGCAI